MGGYELPAQWNVWKHYVVELQVQTFGYLPQTIFTDSVDHTVTSYT